MSKQYVLNPRWRVFARWLATACLLVIFSILMAPSLFAEGDEPAGADPCTSCHSTEGEAWMNSAHGQVPADGGAPAATCEDCHGAYVKGHPDNGVITLRVDSSLCQDCHAETFLQWEDTVHADANVQCISCHQSHSQDLRLTDQQLCRSCHQESLNDSFHTTHWYVEAACTNCHMPQTVVDGALVMAGAESGITWTNHDFTTVSSDTCLNCHRDDVNNPDAHLNAQQLALADLQAQSARVAKLDADLESAQRTTYSLQVMTPIVLGFGLGIGGMLGIVFMLAVSRFNRKDSDS